MIDNYIEEVRVSLGLSRKELAARSGVSYALLNNLEHGRNQLYNCSVRILFRIASALETDPMRLLKFTIVIGSDPMSLLKEGD